MVRKSTSREAGPWEMPVQQGLLQKAHRESIHLPLGSPDEYLSALQDSVPLRDRSTHHGVYEDASHEIRFFLILPGSTEPALYKFPNIPGIFPRMIPFDLCAL